MKVFKPTSFLSTRKCSIKVLASFFMLMLATFASKAQSGDYSMDCGAPEDFHQDLQTPGNGFTYEMWQSKKDSDGCMIVKNNGDFYTSWSQIGNTLVRKSLRNGSARTNQKIDFYVNNSFTGNAFHSCYGWWRDTTLPNEYHQIVEYYVVEDYGVHKPIDDLVYKGNYTVPGEGTYELWIGDDRFDPTVYSGEKQKFTQIKAVRTSPRTSGGITMAAHFNRWADEGFSVKNLYEVSYKIEGFSGGAFDQDVTQGDAYIAASFSTAGTFTGGSGSGSGNLSGTYKMKARRGGRYATANHGNFDPVLEFRNRTWTTQNWTFEHVTGDEYRIRENRHGRYLTTDNFNGADVTVADLNTGWSSQIWIVQTAGSRYKLRNKWTGRYMTNPGYDWGRLESHNNQNWDSQEWYLEAINNASTSNTSIGNKDNGAPVKFYPNPATNFVNVALKAYHKDASITIYSMAGVALKRIKVTSATQMVDISALASGSYLLQVDANGQQTTKIIVKN